MDMGNLHVEFESSYEPNWTVWRKIDWRNRHQYTGSGIDACNRKCNKVCGSVNFRLQVNRLQWELWKMKIKLIYLAAGNSRRFNSQRMQNTEPPQSEAENKLLYLLDEKPMFRYLFDRLLKVCQRHPEWEMIVGNTVSGD